MLACICVVVAVVVVVVGHVGRLPAVYKKDQCCLPIYTVCSRIVVVVLVVVAAAVVVVTGGTESAAQVRV